MIGRLKRKLRDLASIVINITAAYKIKATLKTWHAAQHGGIRNLNWDAIAGELIL